MSRLAAANGDNSQVPAKPEVSRQLAPLLAMLPPGQRRVAVALVARRGSHTYPGVAAKLGVGLGTVHQHLRRIRLRHPKVYAAVMKVRARQLLTRHRRALARAEAHNQRWLALTKRRHFPPFRQ